MCLIQNNLAVFFQKMYVLYSSKPLEETLLNIPYSTEYNAPPQTFGSRT